MRKFNSYGPINTKHHFYAPRTELIDFAYHQLLGKDPTESGHYITVWAPRQTGKTWVMQQVIERLQTHNEFDVALLTMQSAKSATTEQDVFEILQQQLNNWFCRELPLIQSWQELSDLFSAKHFSRPLILILDEFDALPEPFINHFANEFRSIYTARNNQKERKSGEKSVLLHGLALIGVRSVLGIENVSGSPFNVQRSLHIPNLSPDEVTGLFRWYEQESGQRIEAAAIERIICEFQGQPGLTCWMGELLTERYNKQQAAITLADFEEAYGAALYVLPNNNILNIISKAKQQPYVDRVLELFKTDVKTRFTFDDTQLNFLYTNGVIDYAREGITDYYVKFANPFVQRRLFNYFARDLFPNLGQLYAPFDDLSDAFTGQSLVLRPLLRRYEQYLQQNRGWLLKAAPRRQTDFRIFEAVFHFNLYLYLARLLESLNGTITPEFPTGNGKLDLLIHYAGQRYGIEVKSFVNPIEYRNALTQSARYAQQLQLSEITLALFIDAVDDDNRRQYEQPWQDAATEVVVQPVFVVTG